MEARDHLQSAFESVQGTFLRSCALVRVSKREIGLDHYASYLRQVFHHTRENPQIQALATVYFRGHQRAAIKRFFKHASSEIGHDQLAQGDLDELGYDTHNLAFENPLPETTALISFPFHQIYNLNPVGYIGYLYFLEFLPTGSGVAIMSALANAGVPREAMRFLHDHSTIDIAHNQLMDGYIKTLITSERELQSAIYAMRVTGALYARMIESAFAYADAPADWGLSAEESKATYRDDSTLFAEETTGERPRLQWPLDDSAPVRAVKGLAS